MHTDPDSLSQGTILANRYRLDGLIGKGGFGAVFRGSRLQGGGPVAVKVLSRNMLEQSGGIGRFRREAELASRLAHPNTVRVLDAGEDARGWLFIAFELLEGRSVEQTLADHGAMPMSRALSIVVDALSALEEAHSLGIVHRDIKPANIFLSRTIAGENVKVLDFGIAKSTKPGTLAGLTQVGAAMGTPVYMSPEQILGQAVSASSDLFALGIVLADMLMGVSPWGSEPNAIEVVTQRIGGKPVPLPPRISGTRIGEIIHKATELDPARRFASASEMRAAILPLLAATSGALPTPSKRAGLAETFRTDEHIAPTAKGVSFIGFDTSSASKPSSHLAATVNSNDAPSPSQRNRLAATVNSNDAPSPSKRNHLAATVNNDTPFSNAPTQPRSIRSLTDPTAPPPTIRQSSPSAPPSFSSSNPPAGTIEMPTPFAGQAARHPKKRSSFGMYFAIAGFLVLAGAIGFAAYMRAGPFASWLGTSKPKKPRTVKEAPTADTSAESAPTASASPTAAPSAAAAPSASASAATPSVVDIRPCPAIDTMTKDDFAALVTRKGKQILGPANACVGSQTNVDGVTKCAGLEGSGYTLGPGKTLVIYELRDQKDKDAMLTSVTANGEARTVVIGQKRAADLKMPPEEASLLIGDVCPAQP